MARDQITERDHDLFVFGVALQFDDLHPVAQGIGNCVEYVRGRYEEDMREIEGHVEVVITKRRILLRIEDFEQRRSGVAPEVAAEFVDLVKNEDGIISARAAQSLHNLARQRADIGAPVTANFGFIVHPAHRDALELPAQCTRDRAAQRGFASTPGGPSRSKGSGL